MPQERTDWSVTVNGNLPPPFGDSQPQSVLLEQRESGRKVLLRLPAGGNGPFISVEFFDPEGLSATKLQRLPWARWLRMADAAARAFAANSQGQGEGILAWVKMTDDVEREFRGDRVRPTTSNPKRPGRAAHPQDFYRTVASRYLAFCQDGSAKPTHDLAASRHVSRNTAAGWVRKARELGFIPKARGNRPG